MYCTECGEEIPDGSRFCSSCGTNISGEKGTGTDEQPARSVATSDEDEGGGLNITLGKLIAYPVGGLLLLVGLGMLAQGNSVSSLLFILAGGLALPIVRHQMKESHGIALNRWATVAIVLVSVIAGGALADTSPATNPDEPIEADADELVISIEQLDSGWIVTGKDNGTTTANASFGHTGDNAFLESQARVYETIAEADNVLDKRKNQTQERYSTEKVEIGQEGYLYEHGDMVVLVFRDSNVIGVIRFHEEHGFSNKQKAKDYAQLMHENFE